MLTLVVEGRMPLLGELRGNADSPWVEYSELGNAILNEEVAKINKFYPKVKMWKMCIMPDHIHIIVSVSEDMPPGKHLGIIVAGFKGGCSKAAMRLGVTVPCEFAQTDAQGGRPGNGGNVVPLFEKGYNDKILLHEGQLDNWKRYLDDNPRRLLVKKQNPQLFTVLHDMEVANRRCQVVGNRFLLDIPDKVAVIVHRRYSVDEVAHLREEWLACGERGGVLVSAAISPREKEVLREAMNRGYRVIFLRENGFHRFLSPQVKALMPVPEDCFFKSVPMSITLRKNQ